MTKASHEHSAAYAHASVRADGGGGGGRCDSPGEAGRRGRRRDEDVLGEELGVGVWASERGLRDAADDDVRDDVKAMQLGIRECA